MWRKFHEDWERRKSYLIRSLFQEIPLLSPVPEDHESRFGSVSPSDIPASRPHSPLPPLIIERLPNHHDHPPQFYNELEKKMKKLYKKLFHNEDDSSSIEDLLQHYGGDLDDARSLVTITIEEYKEKVNSVTSKVVSEDDNTNFTTAYEVKSISESESSKSTSSHADSNNASSATGTSLQSDDFVTDTRHKDIQSSTETDAQVVVHKTPSHSEPDVPEESPVYEDTAKCSSPIIQLKPRLPYHTQDNSDKSYSESEAASSRHSLDSKNNETQQEEASESSKTDVTNEGIEIMRRQRGISPSLGSLQNNSYDTEASSIGAEVGFKRKASCELDPSECSFYRDVAEFKDVSFSRKSHSFDDILANSSDNSSTELNLNRSSSLNFHRNVPADQVTPTKRIKFGNTAVQTSLADEDESINWNNVMNNFFVGIPKIYKLCSCDQHLCENQM